MRLLLALLLLCVCAAAQTVRIQNFAPTPFDGWVRTTIDRPAPHDVGEVDGVLYVAGRQVGRETRVVDVRVQLAAGAERTIALQQARASTWKPAPLPADPVAWFGGVVEVNGNVAQWVSLRPDGAGYLGHLRCRVGRMLVVDLWAHWLPDQPGWATGEAVVTCSNPAVPDMGETLQQPLEVSFGDSIVVVLGKAPGAPLLAAGARLADGQAKAFPITFVWLRHLRSAGDWSSVGTVASGTLGAVGIERLLPDGNPHYPPGFSPAAFRARFPEAVRRLHTWEHALFGPSPRSSNTGAQEDQVFVRGEALLPGGVGCEQVTYLSALKMAERPCHHCEADGSPIDPFRARAQRLLFWDGRPHPDASVSPERLGKPRTVGEWETEGRWGPDIEHWLVGTLSAATRLTGRPACQHLLATHARIYLLGRTADPALSTSGMFSAREIGWEGLLVVALHENLEDRALAAQVVQRWRDRCTRILFPRLANAPQDVWHVLTDPRLGLPAGQAGWMPWHQSIAAYGLDLACRVVGPTEGRAIALRGARRCVESNWVRLPGENRFRGVGNQPFPPADPSTFDRAFFAGRVTWFEQTWDVPAIDVVLRYEPQHAKALALRAQLRAEIGNSSRSWWPPTF